MFEEMTVLRELRLKVKTELLNNITPHQKVFVHKLSFVRIILAVHTTCVEYLSQRNDIVITETSMFPKNISFANHTSCNRETAFLKVSYLLERKFTFINGRKSENQYQHSCHQKDTHHYKRKLKSTSLKNRRGNYFNTVFEN